MARLARDSRLVGQETIIEDHPPRDVFDILHADVIGVFHPGIFRLMIIGYNGPVV